MTSSLTQPTQLSFNPARFLPIDLSQPVYGGLYPTVSAHPTTANFSQFVHSSFFCKELHDAYTAAGVVVEAKLKADVETLESLPKNNAVKIGKTDYGPQSDSDSCSGSSAGFQHGRSSSPNQKSSVQTEKKKKDLVRDSAYYERRRKNNDAAKRSRDSRRKKEDEVAMRAALLEQENFRLRIEVERLRKEIDHHRIVAINSKLVADVVKSCPSTASSTLSFINRPSS
uniref:BZIP domain-containing protein n=1 Tax=Panagrolaimus sp. JU765 TaxID=591449 RepID=A0AC34QND4_9BILA